MSGGRPLRVPVDRESEPGPRRKPPVFARPAEGAWTTEPQSRGQRRRRAPQALVEVAGTGRCLPERVVTNDELSRTLDTTDAWIRERTGIVERRIAGPDLGVARMGANAGAQALANAGLEASEVDLIVTATTTPGRLLPSTACDIQAALGAQGAAAYDVAAACSGFLFGLSSAEGQIAAGRAETALVISTEKMSSIVDWQDRSTAVLFGDGAGAVVLQRAGGERGILSSFMRSDGRMADLLCRPAGGADRPFDAEVLMSGDTYFRMAGREVYKAAVCSMAEAAEEALQRAGLTGSDIDLFVPHQANLRIIEGASRRAGIGMDRVLVNVDRYGNMSSATIPVALDEAAEEGRLKRGDLVLLCSFGAGFTWAASVLRW